MSERPSSPAAALTVSKWPAAAGSSEAGTDPFRAASLVGGEWLEAPLRSRFRPLGCGRAFPQKQLEKLSMEARIARAAVLVAALASVAAGHRTPNFVVEAPTPQIAQQVGDMAEKFRHDLAVEWLGKPMPNWSQPCPITVQVGDHLGAGGATSFVFNEGEVFGWQMNIQGPLDRVLDSVLPHEVTHTIFASHFRRPLPRWADEGGCTTVEHDSERLKQQKMLIAFLRTGRGIAFSQMFAMKEYPRDILPLYAQGHSLASFLIESRGQTEVLELPGRRDGRRQLGRSHGPPLRLCQPGRVAIHLARLGASRQSADPLPRTRQGPDRQGWQASATRAEPDRPRSERRSAIAGYGGGRSQSQLRRLQPQRRTPCLRTTGRTERPHNLRPAIGTRPATARPALPRRPTRLHPPCYRIRAIRHSLRQSFRRALCGERSWNGRDRTCNRASRRMPIKRRRLFLPPSAPGASVYDTGMADPGVVRR